MAWTNFTTYSHLEALNSLATKSVHLLCNPVGSVCSKDPAKLLSPLFDRNLLTNQAKAKAPKRFIETLYENDRGRPVLDIASRQALLDYIVRERILVRANFIIYLLEDGGVHDFDLWKLSDINEFTNAEMEQILSLMCSVSSVFMRLSIGGSLWMYNFRLTSGFLKKFLCKSDSLCNLKELKLQEVSLEIDIISLLYSCPNLVKLEISHPSITNNHIRKMALHLENASQPSICRSLRSMSFPSSVKEEGIMLFLAHFPNLIHIRCTPFEELLDYLEKISSSSLSPQQYLAHRAMAVLANVRSLYVRYPMFGGIIERLVAVCPKLEQLSLHLQNGMRLSQLANAPCLKRLELRNSQAMPVTFSDYVEPALEAIGPQLTTLSLEYFDHIDLTKCVQHCPRLHTFAAQWFRTLSAQTHLHHLLNIKNPFNQLRHLLLRPNPHHSLHSDTISFALSHAHHLEHIELYCCSEISDQTIDEISSKNPLCKLQTFIMRHGHQVTNEGLSKLVSCASSSGNLVFHDCGLVPPTRKGQ